MLSRHFKRYSFLPLLVLVFLLSLRTAEACSCAGSSTVLDAFNHSDVVVFVSAVSIEKKEPEKGAAPGRASDNYRGVKSTTMRVEQVFKGTVKVGDKMIFSQGGGGDCIWTFDEKDIGKKFLFYLTRHKNFTRWIASICGRSSHAHHASDDLLYLNNLDKVRNKTRISGTVNFSYGAGESVAGRKIRITGTNGTQELATNDDGVYEIYDLPAGRYFVEPEIPKGWKVGTYSLLSPSLDLDAMESLKKIPIILKANKHALLNITFEKDNGIRGYIYDPLGQPMNGVCLQRHSPKTFTN
jgi:hypothetical protein